ncbi:hypothetical protein I4U23_019555 [Adineta vaga]|nr:hypothetical protein I4U23_019555 [Adineta vaga]
MFIQIQTISFNISLCLIFAIFINIYLIQVQASSLNDYTYRRIRLREAEEYIMTSRVSDGMKNSNVCGDGYRIEGALLKSFRYTTSETYLPYEDCFMTFQARRSNNLIRVQILSMDMNDIYGGVNCLDSLRFYKSPYMRDKDKLVSVECGQLNGSEKINFISPTGIVTAHFSTDGGNVNGHGFKVVLTSFRYPNKSHPCDSTDEEFSCFNGDCISSLLLCDGVPHCLDGSDELLNQSCLIHSSESINRINNESDKQHHLIHKYNQWRGILIITFFLIILVVFTIFMVYFFCHRYICSIKISTNPTKQMHSTIVNIPVNNNRKNSATTRTVTEKNENLL